jgi:hypothetical protein
MEIYQDEKTAVTVVPAKKVIFLHRQPEDAAKFQVQRLAQMGMLQDTILRYAQVNFCGEKKGANGAVVRQIGLKMNPEGVKRYQIVAIDFEMDDHSDMISRFTIRYDKPHRLRQIHYEFKALDYNYPADKLSKPALAAVMKGEKTLQDRYAGFRLIDNRNLR